MNAMSEFYYCLYRSQEAIDPIMVPQRTTIIFPVCLLAAYVFSSFPPMTKAHPTGSLCTRSRDSSCTLCPRVYNLLFHQSPLIGWRPELSRFKDDYVGIICDRLIHFRRCLLYSEVALTG